jgi:hypothetical protein
MTPKALALLVAGLVLRSQMAFGGVIYGCANPHTGRVHAIGLMSPNCSRTEELVSWSQVGPTGPLGPPGPPGPAGPRMVVKDSNGQLVGPVMSASELYVVVERPVGAESLLVVVTRSGVAEGPTSSALESQYFETTDCSGPGYRDEPQGGGLFRETFVRGSQVYYLTGSMQTRTIASQLGFGATAASCAAVMGLFTPPDVCCVAMVTPLTLQVESIATFDLSTLGLVPPFHVEGS